LRTSQACEQGQDGQRKHPSAKTYHFLLLVNFKIESVEVLFQPEPQQKFEVSIPFSANLGNFSVSGGEPYSESR